MFNLFGFAVDGVVKNLYDLFYCFLRSAVGQTVFEAESGVSEYEKIDLQAYEKQADKLVKQLKKYQKDYEYVTFESNIHGDLRKTDVEKIRKSFETGT